MVLGAFVCYLFGHFAVYAAVLRHRRITATERGIFLFHLIPAVLWVAVTGLLAGLLESVSLAHIVLIAALHGIYSLTFLELWALADGGYSLAILDCLEVSRGTDEQTILNELARLGSAKKQARVNDLVLLGLVALEDSRYVLTDRGRVLANLVAATIKFARVHMSH
jgi:hypothetical protein